MSNLSFIKKDVLKFNKKLLSSKLVFGSFGNLSIRYGTSFVIKPSGINLQKTHYSKMCYYGKKNSLKPSVDSEIHSEIYKNFLNINAVVHTHSKFTTSFCQAGVEIDCLGTTHADYFNDKIPIINLPNKIETVKNFEKNTGKNIVKYFRKNKINPINIRAALLKSHGLIAWGKNAEEAFKIAIIVEQIAELNFYSLLINKNSKKIPKHVIEKHFQRKNGKYSYYGQK